MQKSSHKKGVIFITLSALSFAVMGLFVSLAVDLPVFQKAFFRNIVATILAFILLMKSDDKLKIQKKSLPTLILRASFGTLGIITNFYAISHINLADAQILNKLSPFFAILMSVFILKEKANKRQMISVLIALIGAVLVVKPGLGEIRNGSIFPYLVGVAGGLFAGIAYTLVRKLSIMGERGTIIVFFFSAFSSVVLIPFIFATYEPMTMKQTTLLLLSGVAACSGQMCVTKAYSYAPAKEISIYDYSSVIFAAMLGLIFLGEFPDILSILGYVIIIGISAYSFVKNRQP